MKTRTKSSGAQKKKLSGARIKPASSTHVKAADVAPHSSFASILVPVDFSAPSLRSIRQALVMARQHQGRITLLNVIEPIGATPDFAYNPLVVENDKLMAATQEQLKKLAAQEGLGTDVLQGTLVRNGVPFNEIVAVATELQSDLIIIATHGYTGFRHVLLGSTAERVVRHAPCPVLVVRGQPSSRAAG